MPSLYVYIGEKQTFYQLIIDRQCILVCRSTKKVPDYDVPWENYCMLTFLSLTFESLLLTSLRGDWLCNWFTYYIDQVWFFLLIITCPTLSQICSCLIHGGSREGDKRLSLRVFLCFHSFLFFFVSGGGGCQVSSTRNKSFKNIKKSVTYYHQARFLVMDKNVLVHAQLPMQPYIIKYETNS